MKIFLASHGNLASGMKSSVDILLGNSENIVIFDAFVDEQNINDVLSKFFSEVKNEQVIMMSDLYGGSVNQVMSLYLNRPNTLLIAGVNLALVLEIAIKCQDISKEEVLSIINQSKEAIHLVDLDQVKLSEDDFF